MIETRGKLITGGAYKRPFAPPFDGVILLLRSESFSLFFSYLNLVIPERFKCRKLHKKGEPLRILVAVVNDVIVQMSYQMYFYSDENEVPHPAVRVQTPILFGCPF